MYKRIPLEEMLATMTGKQILQSWRYDITFDNAGHLYFERDFNKSYGANFKQVYHIDRNRKQVSYHMEHLIDGEWKEDDRHDEMDYDMIRVINKILGEIEDQEHRNYPINHDPLYNEDGTLK